MPGCYRYGMLPGVPGVPASTQRTSSPGSAAGTSADVLSLILVGVDGPRTSLRAAAYASGLARQRSSLLAVCMSRIPATARRS